MLEQINELEKIGLAFISGLVAGNSLQIEEQEVKNEEKIKEHNDTVNVIVKKMDAEKADRFAKLIKELEDEQL